MASQTISAADFWTQFVQQGRQSDLQGYGGDWTRSAFGVLHRVQRKIGSLWCQCSAHPNRTDGASGERLNIDMLWFAETNLLPQEEQWVPPLVAIEHENDYNPLSRAQDHWKVSQVAAPLRVFIGYTRRPDQVESESLVLRAREPRWISVPNGEALLIFGHRDMTVDNFRAWSAPQGGKEWTSLPRVPQQAG